MDLKKEIESHDDQYIIKNTINNKKHSLDTVDHFNTTILHFAAEFGRLELVKYLINHGGKKLVNAQNIKKKHHWNTLLVMVI